MNNISDISDISDWINTKAVLQEDAIEEHIKQSNQIKQQTIFVSELEEATEIIKNLALKTQEQVKFKIAEAGSMMLQNIFDPAPEIDVQFEIKRNQTECQINFKENNQLFSPLDEQGFGVADVAGFGLRIALWGLPAQRSRKVFILDEAFKHLKGRQANVAAIQAVKKISEKLQLQVIMISDERVDFQDIENGADRVFKIDMVDDLSVLEILK